MSVEEISSASGEDLFRPLANISLPADAFDALPPCVNSTLFERYIRSVVRNATRISREHQREMEGDPLVYIVAVLLFYSFGMAVLMINYMKKVQYVHICYACMRTRAYLEYSFH